jgi:hypothetical protein
MTEGAKYFVRASADAPVKGPFTRDAIGKSLERGLMKLDAEARAEDGEEWVTLKSLFKPEEDSKQRRREQAEYREAQTARDMQAAAERARSGGSANVAIGVVMLVAGLALTGISMSAGSRGGVIFVGLIVFGIVRVIRGAAAG